MILIRYSEIFLKGKNRIDFERRLIENIRAMLKAHSSPARVIPERNRILIDDDSATYLKEVFGIHSISVAKRLPIDLEILKREALTMAKEENFKTFRISTQKLNKDVAMTSVEFDRLIGEEVYETLKKKVDLKNPELTIYVEMLREAYIFTRKIQGPGGLPLGSEGKVFALVDDEDGLLAAKMIMRRGCIVYPVSLSKNTFYEEIERLSPGFSIKPIRISSFKELDPLVEKLDAKAIVVPDTLSDIKKYDTALPILRPLITVLPKKY